MFLQTVTLTPLLSPGHMTGVSEAFRVCDSIFSFIGSFGLDSGLEKL